MTKHAAPAGAKIADPILIKHAQDEFGVGRKWLLARIKSGEIRSQRIGHYVVLERSDVQRLAPSQAEVDLLARARARGKRK